jgi:hypothetical protein
MTADELCSALFFGKGSEMAVIDELSYCKFSAHWLLQVK